MNAAVPWKMRTAKVMRFCMGRGLAESCNRKIEPGERFAQCQWRSGLDRAELCADCAKVVGHND